MLKKVVIIGILFLMIIGCKTETTEEVTIENPFIGGTKAIIVDFENLRPEVRDQGQDEFDILVKLENQGETDIAPQDIQVKISGINPAEFSVTKDDLIKSSVDTIISQKKSPEGEITPNPPIFIDFLGLNYQPKITGTQITFPLKADICYKYVTRSVGKLCVRTDALKTEDGICQVTGDKTIYSSSAPVQITNLKENARAKNKVGFTFEVMNAADGDVYEKSSLCDKTQRPKENKVFVRVKTNLPGLKCIGLDEAGTDLAEGYVTLYDLKRIISCTQETPVNDFEQVITISAEYDYEISKTSQIIVKSSGLE